MTLRTQVGIVGAGPAGLLLSHLLQRAGIESIVLENRSREYVEKRVRAGVLEQGTVDLLCATGLGERLRREGLVHRGTELRFDGRGHRIDFADLTGGRCITVYGQQEIVKDMIAARLAAGGPLFFDVDDVQLRDIDSPSPSLRCTIDGAAQEIACSFIAGCDGFHGVCRPAIPAGVLRCYEYEYPFAWCGILAAAPPSSEELIYAHHDRGFALHSMRSPDVSRMYVQCAPTDSLDAWPDERIWEELHVRFTTADGFKLREGPILEKSITGMRSFVAEPLQYGRLFLAGDAAHIVPPTGAKGLNLAAHDVRVLAEALSAWFCTGSEDLLRSYSSTCLRRVWRVQEFSASMTSMLHRFPDDASGFRSRLQRAQLAYLVSSRAAATALAENYVGLERI